MSGQSQKTTKRPIFVSPEDAQAALLVLDEYVDDASMEMREHLINVCEELHDVAEGAE